MGETAHYRPGIDLICVDYSLLCSNPSLNINYWQLVTLIESELPGRRERKFISSKKIIRKFGISEENNVGSVFDYYFSPHPWADSATPGVVEIENFILRGLERKLGNVILQIWVNQNVSFIASVLQ